MPELWERIPKDRKANLEWRHWLLREALKSREVREGVYACCKRDPLFYLNGFVWTYDPRKKAKTIPFISWPYQDRGIHFMLKALRDSQADEHTNADVVIEKSRDMGASWQALFVMEYLWHFDAGNSFLMISRNADLVDKRGDPDSLFWKLDFIHENLPEWMMPPGWIGKKHRLDRHFENPFNGSTIDGAATSESSGVGGRRTAMFIDEFSRIPQSEAVELLRGTADTTRCRIFNFTIQGVGHESYTMARRDDVRKVVMGWWEHPQKNEGLYKWNEKARKIEFLECEPDGRLVKLDGPKYVYPENYAFVMDGVLRSPVYDAEDKRRGNRRHMAMEWDMDYAGSSYQFYDQPTIVLLQEDYAVPPVWEGDVEFDSDTAMRPRLVKVAGGPVKLWLNLNQLERPPAGKYAAGADISYGTGATPSCFSVAHVGRREKVLEYATPFLPPEKFAKSCVALCRLFCTHEGEGARFAWEKQGPGVQFGKKVMELNYGNVYCNTNETSYSQKMSDSPGWNPMPENKRILHSEYRTALATREFINHSREALEECKFFVVNTAGEIENAKNRASKDPTGAGINHGDRVVADALACKMCGPVQLGDKVMEQDEAPVLSLAWRLKMHEDKARQAEDAWD